MSTTARAKIPENKDYVSVREAAYRSSISGKTIRNSIRNDAGPHGFSTPIKLRRILFSGIPQNRPRVDQYQTGSLPSFPKVQIMKYAAPRRSYGSTTAFSDFGSARYSVVQGDKGFGSNKRISFRQFVSSKWIHRVLYNPMYMFPEEEDYFKNS